MERSALRIHAACLLAVHFGRRHAPPATGAPREWPPELLAELRVKEDSAGAARLAACAFPPEAGGYRVVEFRRVAAGYDLALIPLSLTDARGAERYWIFGGGGRVRVDSAGAVTVLERFR